MKLKCCFMSTETRGIWILVEFCNSVGDDEVEVLLYVHRNRRLVRDGSPRQPPQLSHSTWALTVSICTLIFLYTQYDYEHVFRLNTFLSGVPQNRCSLAEEHEHECYYQSKKSLKPIKLKRLFEFVLKPILIWLICIVVLLRHWFKQHAYMGKSEW